MAMRKCTQCGRLVIATAKLCTQCGAPLTNPKKKPSISVAQGCGGCLILVVVIACAGLFSLGYRDAASPAPNRAGQRLHDTLEIEAKRLIDLYPSIRDISKTAVDRQFEFVKESTTEKKFFDRSLQLQEMDANHFANSHPGRTDADVAELKRNLDELNERLAQTFAELVRDGQIAVEKDEPKVADETRDRGDPTPKTSDEIDADGLVLLKSTLAGSRDQFGNGQITGTVINHRDHKLSYAQISFNLYDASGAQIGSAMANINGLEPGGRWKFEAGSFGKVFAQYKFSELSGF